MFEKNLQDLVKGIRATKGDVNIYISQCLQEIKTELKSTDNFIKAQAVRKLTYLHMLGYDMEWAAFHVVEVMSYERFAHKRIGYNAASQSFTQSTDVVLLCTNLLKKEFGSENEYEIGLAINVLANIVTTDLARDLLGDVARMMEHPRSYIRKKSTLVLYKMFLRYPQGLRLTFDKIKQRMEEPEVPVVSCAVNVICELANKKPKNYLGLAPQFFRILTTSSNNWMLIKVVKLFASLVPEEPRLARKLLDPLATVIQNTPAKSLLYECISTVTTALMYTKKSDGQQPRNVPAVVRLCNDHLRRYIEDSDQNLRYLGLVGLSNLMQSHPNVIQEHQAIIVQCLSLDDITIRLRALELLAGMVNPENAAPIIKELLHQTKNADGTYRQELILHILHVCSVNKYANVHDFEWYIDVLVELAHIPGHSGASLISTTSEGSVPKHLSALEQSKLELKKKLEGMGVAAHGIEVSRHLVDIAVRVKSVRCVMVHEMIDLLLEEDARNSPGAATLCEVYYAAAWIAGEYMSEYLDDVDEDDDDEEEDEDELEEKLSKVEDLIEEIMQPSTTTLPCHVQAVIIQSLLKILAAFANHTDEKERVEKLADLIMEKLPAFLQSEYIEVQERSVSLKQILLSLQLGLGALTPEQRFELASIQSTSSSDLMEMETNDILAMFFQDKLAPVSVKAQQKVPIPSGLDLDTPLSSSESSFLLSGGELEAVDDEMEVIFSGLSTKSSAFGNTSLRHQYESVDGSDDNSSKKHRRRSKKNRNSSSSSSEVDSVSDSDQKASSSRSKTKKKSKEFENYKDRARVDPFYLAGDHGNTNTALPTQENDGLMEILHALDATAKKQKKSKHKSSKSKPSKTEKSRQKSRGMLFEDGELMPDGVELSSDDDGKVRKRKNKSARSQGNLLDIDDNASDLANIDLSVPLGAHEKIPDEHLFHRQTATTADTIEQESTKKKKKSNRRSKEEKPKIPIEEKTKREKKDKKKSSNKTENGEKHHESKKKSSQSSDLLDFMQSDDDTKSKSKRDERKSSKSSKRKDKKDASSSKKTTSNVNANEPLLLF